MGKKPLMYILEHGNTKTPLMDGRVLKLGRANSNDIICDDSSASRFHAEIKVENGQVTFRDQESTNGTNLNGSAVRAWIWNILSSGDTISIGEWSATLTKVDGVGSQAKPASSVKRPTVDPAAPQASYEVTSARKLPDDLLKDLENHNLPG